MNKSDMTRRNILYLIDSLSGGGAELVVTNLCKSIDQARFNVAVCCLKELGERGEELLKRGVFVKLVPPPKPGLPEFLRLRTLVDFIRANKVDLIHSHSTAGLVDGALSRMVVRRIRHVHTFHFGNYPCGPAKMLILERVFSRFPDRLVAVGVEQRKALTSSFRLSSGRIQTIWNGIEIPRTENPERSKPFYTSRIPERPVACSLSTLIEQKGISFLLDAVSLLVQRKLDFELWVVGDGPLREALEAKCRHLGLTTIVKFLGWIPKAPEVVLPKIDLFVQPSLWEAMSMAVLEAMAAGKPVLVTDVGDNRHLIEHGKEGIVVPRMDALAMAQEMERLLSDPELRLRLGRNARRKVNRLCTARVMADQYQRLYLDVLGDRTGKWKLNHTT